jgi:hypothetical protein
MAPRHQVKIGRVLYLTILIVIILLQTVLERPASAISALTSSFNWQFVGPEPSAGVLGFLSSNPIPYATGRVTVVAADASNRIFVGTAGGGLWLSADGGTTFNNINGSVLPYAIGAIALDTTTSPTTVYVGTGEAARLPPLSPRAFVNFWADGDRRDGRKSDDERPFVILSGGCRSEGSRAVLRASHRR